MVDYAYCPKCNKDVELVEVSLGTRGAESVIRCTECGYTISHKSEETEEEVKRQAPPSAHVVIVGYTAVNADLLTAAIVRKGFAEEVSTCNNGEEYLVNIIKLLRDKNPPKLIITEVKMPILNGINASLCLRSIENGMGRAKIPILFFSQKELDDQFERAVKFLTPARYVPLPKELDTEAFRQRAEKMLDLLMKEQW